MGITRGATISTYLISSTVSKVSQPHTVDSGTTLMILVISQEAISSLTVQPNWNVTEAFTLIHATTSSGLSGDVRNYTYGIVNPTSGTHNITYTSTSNDNIHHSAINYLGTETSSVALATGFLQENVNNLGAKGVTFSSAGTDGNVVLGCGVMQGGDGFHLELIWGPSSVISGLSTGNTGASTLSDISFGVVDSIFGGVVSTLPTNCFITFNVTDEVAGQYIEIKAPIAATNLIKYWTGSAWVEKPVKYWTGSEWLAKPIKYWTGSEWL